MNKMILACTLILSIAYAEDGKVEAVKEFNQERYLGKWYEIARLPNFFQKECTANISAVYSQENGGIAVLNSCTKKDGVTETAHGFATIENAIGSQLKVSFLPSYIRWLPFTKGDYWILRIDPDYQVSLVGDPDHQYLWILARAPTIEQSIIDDYLNTAKAQGYVGLEKMIYTKNDPNSPP